MSNFSAKMGVILAVVLSLACAVYGQGPNPCHTNKVGLGAGVKCEGVVLPPQICSKCGLKDVQPNGNLKNCKSIYNIDTPQCKAELQKYVNMNQCDWKRKEQVQRWNGADIQGLDYFLYSLCEQCCDCIKKGAQVGMFASLKGKHGGWNNPALWTVNRGNCPAHAFYDICKVLPNVRYITAPGVTPPGGMPKACPLFNQWFHSPASNDWMNKQNSYVSPQLKTFLNLLNRANGCESKDVWTKCLIMEQKQRRV